VSKRPSRVLGHVLVGVGGSARSLVALRYAIHLARSAGSPLEALIGEDLRLPNEAQVLDGDVLSGPLAEVEAMVRERWDEAERAIDRLSGEQGYPVTVRRERGRIADRIVAAGTTATLVVLGKRGCRPEHGGLLGSNSEVILRRTSRPVLLTPDEFVPPRRVLVAQGGKTMGMAALGIGLTLAKALRVPLTVLTVEGDHGRRDELWHEIREVVSKVGVLVSFQGEEGLPGPAILRYADAETLLTIGAYGHTRAYRMVLGSVTEEVMRGAAGPVLLSGK